jgi:hypothetical protein
MEVDMDDRNVELLDAFGQAFIHRVRDGTLEETDDILMGRGHPEWKRELHALLERSMDENQRALLRRVVAIAVDTAMHNVLWMIESTPELRLEAVGLAGERHDLVAASDGLSGELWTEDGWIARFSRDRDPGLRT